MNHDRCIEDAATGGGGHGFDAPDAPEAAQREMDNSDLKVLVRSTAGLEYIKASLFPFP